MFSNRQYQYLAATFYGFCFLTGIKSFFDNALLHQLQSPVLWDMGTDLLTALGLLTGMFRFLVSVQPVAVIFDCLLIFLPLFLLFKPQQRTIAIVNFFTWLIYALVYNLYGTHQTHSLAGILIIHIPFLFYQSNYFGWLWEGSRYYTLWIMFSAGAWKIIRGSAFLPEQGKNIYIQNHIGSILETGNADPVQSFFLLNPWLLNISFPAGVLLELIFVIGFFTKKFDQWLIIALMLLIIGFRIFADATFIELSILALPLLFSKKQSPKPDTNHL